MIEFVNEEKKNFVRLQSEEIKREILRNVGFLKDFNADNITRMEQLTKIKEKKKSLLLLKEKLQQDLSNCDEEEKEIVEKKIKHEAEYPPMQLRLNVLKSIISTIKHINIDFKLLHVNDNLFTAKLVFLNVKKESIKIVIDMGTEMVIEYDLGNLKNVDIKNDLIETLKSNKSCKVFFTKLCEYLVTK